MALISQQPYFINYNTSNGLPSNNVYYTLQTSDRCIWISSDLGISRFNGEKFKNFNIDDGLSDNEVFQIHEDNDHRLWMLTFNGSPSIFCIDRFYNSSNLPFLNYLKLPSYLSSFTETSRGYCITSSGGELKYIDKRGEVMNFGNDSTNFFNSFNVHDSTYILTNHGIGFLDIRNSQIHLTYRCLFSNYAVKSQSIGDDIILGFNREVLIYNLRTNQLLVPITIDESYINITSINITPDKRIWIGTRAGLLMAESVENLREGFFKKYFTGEAISNVMQDDEGGLWVSSLDNGVYYIPTSSLFTYNDVIMDNKVLSLEHDASGTVWVGGDKNNYYAISNNGVEKFQLKNSRAREIRKIRHLGNNTMMIIGKSGTEIVSNGKVTTFPYWSNDILMDDQSYYWLSMKRTLRVSPNELLFGNQTNISNRTEVISESANVFYKDSSGSVWIGGLSGLYEYSRGTIINWSATNFNLAGAINDIIEIRPDTLAIATQMNGLVFFSNGVILATINKFSRLSSNSCVSLFPDKSGNLWVGTVGGLDKISFKKGEFSIENVNGKIGAGPFRVFDVTMSNSLLFMATSRGVMKLDTAFSDLKYVKPGLKIEKVHHNGEEYNFEQPLKLKYRNNNIEVVFSGTSFRNHTFLRYKYFLEGADSRWNITNTGSISYNLLPPGNYKLHLVAEEGPENLLSDELILSFRIMPPYYRTWWFYLLMVLIVLSIFIFVGVLRMKWIRRQYEMENIQLKANQERIEIEKKIAELEQLALRLQMNPHFIFNALNTIKGYYIENKVEEAGNYIGKFAKLLRIILENSDYLIPISIEVNILELYLELSKIRYQNRFNYVIKIAESIDPDRYIIPTMIVQPFVENAIIHGIASMPSGGEITVSFTLKNELLIIIVEDNGIGLNKSQQKKGAIGHQSKSISLTKERLLLINREDSIKSDIKVEDIGDKNANLTGTRVTITIPAKKIW